VIGKDEMLICGSKHTELDVHLGNQPRQLAMKRRTGSDGEWMSVNNSDKGAKVKG
jgi:hypothetical protein